MGRFNLLDEPWISVLTDNTEGKKDVSMLEFFRNAGGYYSLAGEMETQNFAVMRFLLSVIQTVFSRFDYHGNVLPGIELDERGIQTEAVDEDDLDEYCEATAECWKQLYASHAFPDVLFEYLEKWRDRFYLFDEEHPFFQVNKIEMDEITTRLTKQKKPTVVHGKTLNRTISESGNTIALFSPVVNTGKGKESRKDVQTEAELTRWLLMFQGYCGVVDKASLVHDEKGQQPSIGWLFELGGIYLQGSNVFETLVMNYMPESPVDSPEFSGRIQKPCWEFNGSDVIRRINQGISIDNLAELYTNWSRAVYIAAEMDISKPVAIQVVKLPKINYMDNCIEPMTLWKCSGKELTSVIPKRHNAEESLWRYFGMITMRISNDGSLGQRQPGVFGQYQRLAESAGSRWTNLVGVSMKDDGNSSSQRPVDEITDSFRINDLVITDTNPDGWVIRINTAVESTKNIVSVVYRNFLEGICEIRNLKVSPPMDPNAAGFITRETAIMYAIIDPVFREWLSHIEPGDSKEDRIKEWYSQLRRLVLDRGEELFENSTAKDLTGIEKGTSIENIATKYWTFINTVNNKFK